VSEGSSNLTNAVVDQLIAPLTDSLPQEPTEIDDLETEQRKSIFEKIRFNWRPEDQTILGRIGVLVDQEFSKDFFGAVQIFENFFGAMHVPETQWFGNQEVNLKDAQGRQVYKRGPDGHLIEDYRQLTGQDFEVAILRLEKLRLDLRPRISELLADAVYAKSCAGDFHDDAYHSTYDGTINDRNARANRESRPDRYHAFFRWTLWQTCKDFYDEIGQFITYLEKIRTWKSFER
jgi:hypothetical protein